MVQQNPARLTVEDARNKGAECRDLARQTSKPAHRLMLEHMAETWDRVAINLAGKDSPTGI
jgi:hypothetical protein